MKICEAFRAKWEALNTPDYILCRDAYINALHWNKRKGKTYKTQLAHFEAWYKNACSYLLPKDIKKYGLTLEQLQAAEAAGYMRVEYVSNTATRFRGAPSTYWYLTKEGSRALFKAYDNWISEVVE